MILEERTLFSHKRQQRNELSYHEISVIDVAALFDNNCKEYVANRLHNLTVVRHRISLEITTYISQRSSCPLS